MRQFGLIGYPLSQSFSKKYFEEKFEREGLTDCSFQNFPISSIVEFPKLLTDHPSLQGLAITIPYKQQVMQFLDDSSSIPAGLHACNCMRIRDGRLTGFNTDHIGFEKSLQPLLESFHRTALVLGNGGATAAVNYALDNLGIQHNVVSRKKTKDVAYSYDELDEQVIASHQLIINTTPLGMYPAIENFPDLPYNALGKSHLLYDLVYNPTETVFLKKGKEKGAQVKNGLEMLELQAEENWKIWNS